MLQTFNRQLAAKRPRLATSFILHRRRCCLAVCGFPLSWACATLGREASRTTRQGEGGRRPGKEDRRAAAPLVGDRRKLPVLSANSLDETQRNQERKRKDRLTVSMTPRKGLEAQTPRARWEHRSSADAKLTKHRSKDGPNRVRIEARPDDQS